MSDLDFTPEEQAAIADMQSEGAPPPEPEKAPEPVQEAQEAPAEPVAEAAAPEPEKAGDKPPEGYVPHGALHAERVKRQEIEAELRQIRELLAAQNKPEPEPEPEMPDPITDPDEFKAWYQAREAKQRESVEEIRQRHEASAQDQQLRYAAAQAEAQFRAQAPDYEDAYRHLAQQRVSELQLMGLSPQQIQQQVLADEKWLVQSAMQRGENPAALVYKMAQGRGYRPAQAQAATQPQPNEAARLAAQKAAQEATESLAGASNDAGKGELTLEVLANMSEKEIGEVPEEVIRKVMGG